MIPSETSTPAARPATSAYVRFIRIPPRSSSVAGRELEVHRVAEREAPVPAVVLPDLGVVPVDRGRALAHVLLRGGDVDRDPERVGAPVVPVPFRAARVPVDPVFDV